MSVRVPGPAELEQFLALAGDCLRPDGGPTTAEQDFPLALGPNNREGLLALEDGGRLTAGLSCLRRTLRTSLGELPVVMVGSVFTRPEARGRGLSRRLQQEALARATAEGTVLAVLWTDRPELYAGRGFAPAGLEYHVDLAPWRPRTAGPAAADIRDYHGPDDAPAAAALHRAHRLGVLRTDEEDAVLRAMPGTRGLVLVGPGGAPVAHVFCGKGADFRGWVHEWAGEPAAVMALLARARELGLARWVLVPQGGEELLARLVAAGAAWRAVPSALWRVLDATRLRRAAVARGVRPAEAGGGGDPAAWLGGPAADGRPVPGPLRAAIWGFDSI